MDCCGTLMGKANLEIAVVQTAHRAFSDSGIVHI